MFPDDCHQPHFDKGTQMRYNFLCPGHDIEKCLAVGSLNKPRGQNEVTSNHCYLQVAFGIGLAPVEPPSWEWLKTAI